MEKIIAGKNVEVNEEGYMLNLNEWNKEIANELAAEHEIAMNDEHWKVINFLQDQHRNEVPLSIRKIGKSGVVDIKKFYALFPNGPLKISSKIAGITKPVSCI